MNTDPLLLVKFPSRGRYRRFFDTLALYLSLASPATRMFVLMTFDVDDDSMPQAAVASELRERFAPYAAHIRGRAVWGVSGSKIGAVNRDMDAVAAVPWTTVLLASDDMLPERPGYNDTILACMRNYYPDNDGVLWFNDGHRGEDLNTLCILGRAYYNRFGYIYHPAYKSLWCDNEFMDVANALGRQTRFGDVLIRHHHPAYDAHVKKDGTYAQNDRHYRTDGDTYRARLARGFDLKLPATA